MVTLKSEMGELNAGFRARTVGRNNHQRNILIKCFRHSRMKIEQRRAGSTTDGSRFAAIQSQPNGKIARC